MRLTGMQMSRMRGRGIARVIGLLAALALVAAACSNAEESNKGSGDSGSDSGSTKTVDEPGVTDDTIRVGGVASISNLLNAPYSDIFKGAKAYFDMVDAEGGIYGRSIEVVSERDDQMGNNLREVEGLLSQDDVFAAIGMATIADFSGAEALEQAGIPTFGWNINEDWTGKQNLFGNAGALCIGCVGVELPWIAQELGKKKVGVLGYNVPSSKKCAEGVRDSFEALPSAGVGFYSDSLSFGTTDFSVEVGKMKDAGVDFVTTCMDTNAVLAIAKELRKQDVDAIQYLPNGYDQAFMEANGEFFEGSIVRVPFVPYETKTQPQGLKDYLKWMKKAGFTPNEYTTYGWINAAMLVEGLKAAGPDFTQQKVVDALNEMTDVDVDGLLSGIDWTTQHTDTTPPVSCAAYVVVKDGKFLSKFVPKDKTFVCHQDEATLSDDPTFE